jgi:inosose dehydratase
MGIQSYSLRGYDLAKALQLTQELGLHYWEAFPDHIPEDLDAAHKAAVKNLLHAAGIRLLNYGVVGFGGDQASNRRTFEFAREMGIRTLSADPDPESMDQLDSLVDEFRINIAIHNHGPGSRYSKLESVANAVKGRHPRIGACVDTGHYLHSQVDPVVVVQTLGPRVLDVHLKDGKGDIDNFQFTVVGQGNLNMPGLFKALKRLHYHHLIALEYEDHPENPMDDIRASFAAIREALA